MADCGAKNVGKNKSVSALADIQSAIVGAIEAFTPDPSFIKNSIPFIFGDGKPVDDTLTAIINSTTYTDFISAQITRSVSNIAGTFTLTLRDKWRFEDDSWPFVPGTKIQLQAGSFPQKSAIVTGFIDRVEVSVSAEDREIVISGRDKTGDLVDCAPDLKGSEFKNLSLLDIAKKLCEPFGIGVTFVGTQKSGSVVQSPGAASIAPSVSKKTKPKFNIRPGESVFNILHDLVKEAGYLMFPDEFGDLIIFDRTTAGLSKSPVPLTQGENILSAQAVYDFSDRYSLYIVKGQSYGTDNFSSTNSTEPEGRASDCAIDRYRSTVVISERNVDKAGAQKRAEWEATTRATRSTDVRCVVQGWSRPDGSLWSINELVTVHAGFIGIGDDMVVNSVAFSKNTSGGTLTTLGLSRKDSYVTIKEVDADKDPIKRPLGWQSPGAANTIENVYKLFGKKIPPGF